MDTNSDKDNHSIAQELSTVHYEENEVSDQEQETSVTDTDQAQMNKITERQCMVYILIWVGITYQTITIRN